MEQIEGVDYSEMFPTFKGILMMIEQKLQMLLLN